MIIKSLKKVNLKTNFSHLFSFFFPPLLLGYSDSSGIQICRLLIDYRVGGEEEGDGGEEGDGVEG